MLPHAVLCRFDALARSVRGNVEPFGGIQMLLSGDFHKLPPVAGRSIFPQPSGGREVSAECAAWGFQTIQLKDSFASGALPRDAIHDTFLKGVRERIAEYANNNSTEAICARVHRSTQMRRLTLM